MNDPNTSPATLSTGGPRPALFKGAWSFDRPQNCRGVRIACRGEKNGEGARPVVAELELTVEELELLVALARVR